MGVTHNISEPVAKKHNEENLLENSVVPKGVNTTAAGGCKCAGKCPRCRTDNPQQRFHAESNFRLSSIGNFAIQQALLGNAVQTKPNLSQTNDLLEREADAVASQVMGATQSKPVNIGSVSQSETSLLLAAMCNTIGMIPMIGMLV